MEVKEGMEELKKLWEEKQAPPEKEGWEAFQDGDAPVDEVEKKEVCAFFFFFFPFFILF